MRWFLFLFRCVCRVRRFCGPKRLSKILTTKKKVILFLLKKSRMYRRVTSSTLDRFARKVYRRGVAFFVNLRGAAFGMPLFAEVLSTKDCKNTYKSNIKDSTWKRNVFSFLVFSLFFFVGKRHGQKIRVLAFIKKRKSVVLLLRVSERWRRRARFWVVVVVGVVFT